MKVCYPGTFDPITKGHLDIIERASKQFDEVVVLVMSNPNKKSLFSKDERKELIENTLEEVGGLQNVKVVVGEGLTVEMAKELGATALIRGIRAVSDYEYELQQATANMALDENIETIFMIAKPKYSFLSSSIVKEIAHYDGDISEFIPSCIIDDVMKKMNGETE